MPRSFGVTNAAPYAVAPPVGAPGDTYFNTTSKLLFLSDGTSWIQVQSGGGGSITADGFTRKHSSAIDQNIAIGTGNTDIPLATVVDSAGSTYTPNGANTNFVIPSTGLYDISCQVAASSSGFPAGTWISLMSNGNVVLARRLIEAVQGYDGIAISVQRYLTVGTTVGLTIYATGATTYRTMPTANGLDPLSPYLSVWRAGTGPIGPQGTPGPQGPAGTGTASALTSRGEWSSASSYNPMEVVTRNGVAFLAMSANANVDPTLMPAGSFAAIGDFSAQISAIGKNLAWTPVLRQGGIVPTTTNAAWYSRVGEWVIAVFDLRATGGGTAGQSILLDLPVPIRSYGGDNLPNIGTCFITAGGNTYTYVLGYTGSTTQVGFAVGGNFYQTTIANNNYVNGTLMYLAPVGV